MIELRAENNAYISLPLTRTMSIKAFNDIYQNYTLALCAVPTTALNGTKIVPWYRAPRRTAFAQIGVPPVYVLMLIPHA